MMKRSIFILCFLGFFYSNISANSIYTKIGFGNASVKGNDNAISGANALDFTKESIFTIAIGKKINQFDFELEYTREKNKWKNSLTNYTGSNKTNNLIINGFCNFEMNIDITPYLGLGSGYASTDDNNNDETYFFYQGMAGISTKISENYSLGLEYRYKDTNSKFDLKSNNALLNLISVV